jgi:cell migration-inducing and hyaluronan-binding protein
MAPKLAPHELDFDPLESIPFSDIVASTPGVGVNKTVYIHAHEIAHLDQSVEMDQLIINGQLHCDQTRAPSLIEIKARVIYVNGIFQCGNINDRYYKKLIISLKPGEVDPRQSPAYRGLVVNNGGKLILNGNNRNANWTKLSQTALPGDNVIAIDQNLTGSSASWKVGDEIVIGPSSYNSSEAESFFITRVEGNLIKLSANIQYRHLGQTEKYSTKYNGEKTFDPRAEVANLTRNILIRPDESSGPINTSPAVKSELGGHVMIMNGGRAFVDSVEFYKMGQAGMMARYPFHWHWTGNATGQYIVNSSVHRSFQRCIVIHRTNNAKVSNNVCYDFKGHGYFLEDGVEINNIITYNLGIGAKFPYSNKSLLHSDNQFVQSDAGMGRFPNVSVFWVSNPQNTLANNVASGSVGTGFWMSFEEAIKNSQGQTIANPVYTNTTLFEKNVAHSALVGFTWDGARTQEVYPNLNNPDDRVIRSSTYNPPTPAVLKNLVSYKNKLSGYYFRGVTAVVDGGISADNSRHYWLAFHQIVKNALIIGRSQQFTYDDQVQAIQNNRADRNIHAGVVIYDGPFELNGVDFHNFSTQQVFHQNNEVTTVPIRSVNGFDKLINLSQRVSFSPEPLHRVYMPQESNVESLELIGSSGVRDLDGTLTGTPGVLVGRRSLGITNNSQCMDLGISFQGFMHCPPRYSETMLHFFGGPFEWNMPFVAQRSDGKLNFEKSQWSHVLKTSGRLWGGMRIALSNSATHDYEVMFLNNPSPDVWTISEVPNPIVPVTKLIGQGQGCYLKDVPAVQSLAALRNSTSNAYFSSGNDLYFKLIPQNLYWTIKPGNTVGVALGYRSFQSKVICNGAASSSIVGQVESVRLHPLNETVKIRGWACRTSESNAIQVNMKLKQFLNRPAYTVSTQMASLDSEAAINFKCVAPNTRGYRFEFNLSRAQVQQYQGFYVLVDTPSGQQNIELDNSTFFTIPRLPSLQTRPKLSY